jgi:hypothetical protein
LKEKIILKNNGKNHHLAKLLAYLKVIKRKILRIKKNKKNQLIIKKKKFLFSNVFLILKMITAKI